MMIQGDASTKQPTQDHHNDVSKITNTKPVKRKSNEWSVQTQNLLTNLKNTGQERGNIHVTIELLGKTEGHPMFKVNMRTKNDNYKSITVLMKRFKHFRALHNKIGKLSKLKRIYRNRFPDSHWQSHFGILGDEYLQERAEYLESWLNEVLCLSDREGWGIDIHRELTSFLEPESNPLSHNLLNIHNGNEKTNQNNEYLNNTSFSRKGSFNRQSSSHNSSLSNNHEDDDVNSYRNRSSSHQPLNETWPQLVKRTTSLPPSSSSHQQQNHHQNHNHGLESSENGRSRADSSVSRLSSLFFIKPSSSSSSHWDSYTDPDLIVTIFEGELMDIKTYGVVKGLGNKWRRRYWKLVWSDSSKSEAALLRYSKKPSSSSPSSCSNIQENMLADGSGGGVDICHQRQSISLRTSSLASSLASSSGDQPRDVIALRTVRTIDRVSDHHLDTILGQPPDFIYGFVLILTDNTELIFSAVSEQDRQEWMGILYSSLIRQVSKGQHDDPNLISNVGRASVAWESKRLPEDEDEADDDGSSSHGHDSSHGAGGGVHVIKNEENIVKTVKEEEHTNFTDQLSVKNKDEKKLNSIHESSSSPSCNGMLSSQVSSEVKIIDDIKDIEKEIIVEEYFSRSPKPMRRENNK